MTIKVRFVALATTLTVAACVESEPPPNIPLQAPIPYGPRIYLADFSQSAPSNLVCTKFGTLAAGTSTVVNALPGFGTGTVDLTEPHNCFIPVVPDTLLIDRVEITNDLFQLCVDSGVCSRPDPSDASQDQVCSSDDDFERCPVVDVPRSEAERLCQYIGRRLPSMVEHIIARQAEMLRIDGRDPNDPQPEFMAPFITGTATAPVSCNDALLNSPGCNATRPSPVGSAQSPQGGAPNDVVLRGSDTPVFDLTGSQREWAADLFVDQSLLRPEDRGLPWFCAARLPPSPAGVRPTCPANTACVYGQFAPEGFDLDIYPVCITSQDATFRSGGVGSLSGGGIDSTAQPKDARTIGVFSRRIDDDPNAEGGAQRSYGFRCAGDLPTADGDPTDMVLPEDDVRVQVDTSFQP